MIAMPALVLRQLGTLSLQRPLEEGRPDFIAAASGLVRIGAYFYVVADDELQLGVFSATPLSPGIGIALLPGELPLEPAQRKQSKPDFEVLAYLPPTTAAPFGTLLALGSGSRSNRALGVQLALGEAGQLAAAPPRVLDLAPLYAALEREFGIVNIEGAVVQHSQLLLFQRGNKKNGVNAIVELDLAAFLRDCAAGVIAIDALRNIQRCELGAIDGVALGFTDATCLPGGELLALVVAEDTDDPYADGATLGSCLCRFDSENQLRSLIPLMTQAKTEGITLWSMTSPDEATLAFVTDADDPALPAQLLLAPLRIAQ